MTAGAGVEWDFRAGLGGLSDRTGHGLTLSGPHPPRWEPDPVVGGAMVFDGVRDHLRVESSRSGPLDAARFGDEVSVFALVRRDTTSTGFVAGMWQEDDRDPRRQYGLFLSLPTYGGAQQVIGHVSHDGRPSPGLPYSRDYSASARMVAPGTWRVVGFTYDGCHAVSFLDGTADRRPAFTEVGPPLGAGLVYAKNPYRFGHGLNRSARAEFTVGAVRLTTGMGNHLAGAVARLAVWPRALPPAEIVALAASWTPPARPLVDLDLFRPAAVPATQGGAGSGRGGVGGAWPLGTLGWTDLATTARRPSPVMTLRGLVMPASTWPRLVAFDSIDGVAAHGVTRFGVEVRRGRGLRLAVRIRDEWFASTPLRVGGNRIVRAGGWTRLRSSRHAASVWRPSRRMPLPPGAIGGIGILRPAASDIAVVRRLTIWR